MKTKLILIGLLLAVSSTFTACNEPDGGKNDNDANKRRESALLEKYPQAEKISWSKSQDNRYDIATFILPVTKAAANADTVEVWFGQDDNMRLVNQEISFESLPAAVQSSFETTKCNPAKGAVDNGLINTLYSDKQLWEIDDIYRLERDGIASYKIEMDAIESDTEVTLYYDEQGILLREVTGAEEELPLEIPANIQEWIKANYPDAEILDYEMEEEDGVKEHELDLKNGKTVIEITLAEKNNTLEVPEQEYNYPGVETLPQDIQIKVRELIGTLTGITEESITEIEMEKESDGSEVYTLELEDGDTEITIEIVKDSEGVITGKVLEEESED